MATIEPNSTPLVGNVAIFYYKSVKHIALITRIQDDGFFITESNYKAGVIGERFIPWNYYALHGFYNPNGE